MDKPMTRERLELYQNNKGEIKDFKYKLAHLGEDDSLVGNDVIMDYTTGYARPQTVVGYDYVKEETLRNRYIRLIEKLEIENKAIENFIFEIQGGIERRIFILYFIDGLSMERVSQKVHFDKSSVSRKIDNYLKLATNATNATL